MPDMETLTLLLTRLGLTMIPAFLFGYERQRSRKPIGFGTFIFVSVGACSLALIAKALPGQNTVPLLAAIVTGIGFLGAGALIKTGEKIHGFTSAALIWLFAIFGLAIGVGEIILGMTIYLIIWLVSLVDQLLQNRSIGAYKKQLSVTVTTPLPTNASHNELLARYDCRLVGIRSEREPTRHTFVYDIAVSAEDATGLVGSLLESVDVVRVDLE